MFTIRLHRLGLGKGLHRLGWTGKKGGRDGLISVSSRDRTPPSFHIGGRCRLFSLATGAGFGAYRPLYRTLLYIYICKR